MNKIPSQIFWSTHHGTLTQHWAHSKVPFCHKIFLLRYEIFQTDSAIVWKNHRCFRIFNQNHLQYPPVVAWCTDSGTRDRGLTKDSFSRSAERLQVQSTSWTRDWCIKFATGVKKVTKWSFYSTFWLAWLQMTDNNTIWIQFRSSEDYSVQFHLRYGPSPSNCQTF